MSMSTHIIGFIPPDKKWKEMKAIYDACVKANIEVPEAVNEFFNGYPPDPKGRYVEVQSEKYNAEGQGGIEIELSKIPKNVKFIRFYNSW